MVTEMGNTSAVVNDGPMWSSSVHESLDGVDPKLSKIILPWIIRNPRYIGAALRMLRGIRSSKRLRAEMMKDGIKVPPFMILSITRSCNLRCLGCYAAASQQHALLGGCGAGADALGPDVGVRSVGHGCGLELSEWRRIVAEASGLGVFGFIIAGGEPFMMPGFIDLCREFRDRFFIVLTNGTCIGRAEVEALKRVTNLVVVISIEGGREQTDARRGVGVHEMAIGTMHELGKAGVPFGLSVTVTRNNFRYWMDARNLDAFIAKGAKLAVFIEYIPTGPGLAGPDVPQLTPRERQQFRACMLDYRERRPVYIIHSPGDEELLGGCVSAGRGFAHVTAEGDLTPCPVSRIATHNLKRSSLREGLASSLFVEIRESEHLLETEGVPCALLAHPEAVEELARKVGAYRTDMHRPSGRVPRKPQKTPV